MTLRRLLLKICYQSNLKYISLASDAPLEKLMEIIMERFKLSRTANFEICVVTGEVLNAESYSNFVSDYPKSNCILYVRSVIVNRANSEQSELSTEKDNDVRECQLDSSPDISFYKNRSLSASGRKMWATPVMRQNCFINVFPENKSVYSKRHTPYSSTRVFRIRN